MIDDVSAALNRELYKNVSLRKASAKRAKRVFVAAAADWFAEEARRARRRFIAGVLWIAFGAVLVVLAIRLAFFG